MALRELALFAGAGGGLLGSRLIGWRTVCAVEIDAYCRDVLFARQRDGALEEFPIWDDIRTFDGRPWRGSVDIVTGGFPCQDISAAGKGQGIEGAKSSLWFEMARVVREIRPRFVLVENSPRLTTRGLNQVLGDLAALGYDARWGVLGAYLVGAHHQRNRLWIVANADREWKLRSSKREASERGAWVGDVRQYVPDSECDTVRVTEQRTEGRRDAFQHSIQTRIADDGGKGALADSEIKRRATMQSQLQKSLSNPWPIEPDVGRVAHGVARRMDRLRAIGNGQVPRVVQLAWEILR